MTHKDFLLPVAERYNFHRILLKLSQFEKHNEDRAVYTIERPSDDRKDLAGGTLCIKLGYVKSWMRDNEPESGPELDVRLDGKWEPVFTVQVRGGLSFCDMPAPKINT